MAGISAIQALSGLDFKLPVNFSKLGRPMRYRMAELFLYFTIFVLSVASVQSQEIEASLTDEELAWIAENPVIRATNEMDWAPIDFRQDGRPVGFSVDYLNLIAQKTGLQIEYINGYTWEGLLDLLREREIDIAQSITYAEQYEDFLDYTDPYLAIPQVFFGRVGEARINSIDDLEGKKIGVIQEWAEAYSIREKFSQFDFTFYASNLEALLALSVGEIDLFTMKSPAGNYIIAHNFISNVEVVGIDDFIGITNDSFISVATRSDWPILNSIIKKGIEAVSEEEFNEISNKWRFNFYANQEVNLTPQELTWLASNRVIRIAADPNSEPLEFVDREGKVSGIAGAYLKEIEEKLGITFEWIGNQTWLEGMEQLRSGNADVIAVVTPTEERSEFLSFTDNFLDVAHMIFGLDGKEVFANMDGLQDHKVVQVRGNALTEKILNDYPDLDITIVDSALQALKLLAIGEVDAYVASIPVASHKIASEGLTQIVVAGETPYRGEYAIGIRSDLTQLSSAINKAMRTITAEERAEISRNWLVLRVENEENTELIINILAGAFIVFAVILAWNYSLQREINRRIEIQGKLENSEERAKRALVEAETANEAKSSFLANMSHEIRTPLNAIIGFSEAMLMGVGGKVTSKKHQEYLSDINNSAEHLSTVIKDILDLSKIEAGKWHLNEKEFLFDDCIQDVFKMLEPHAQQKNIDLNYENGHRIEIKGDEHAFKRIAINLISNSIKFTDQDGFIQCVVRPPDEQGVEIDIIDNGIGIPADRIDRVLTPFEQSIDGYELNEEGTGLGLSIVKKLVDLHDGAIKISSKVNEGTCVTISIPGYRLNSQPGNI